MCVRRRIAGHGFHLLQHQLDRAGLLVRGQPCLMSSRLIDERSLARTPKPAPPRRTVTAASRYKGGATEPHRESESVRSESPSLFKAAPGGRSPRGARLTEPAQHPVTPETYEATSV